MTTFLLLHGGAHGKWCWDSVVPFLETAGHRAVAVDLPMVHHGSGALEWAMAAAAALDPSDDDVVAVAHSLSGLALPLVATLTRVRRIVFVSAMVPVIGMSHREYRDAHPEAVSMPADRMRHDETGRGVVPRDTALEYFFHDCPADVAELAWERLVPVAPTVITQPCPLETWPTVAASYMLGTKDRSVNPEWSRRAARELLGVQAVELECGHSPFLACPQSFAEALCALPA